MLNLNTPFRPVNSRPTSGSVGGSVGGSLKCPLKRPVKRPSSGLTPSPPIQKKHKSGCRNFSVLWRKVTQRKNKPWDGDGTLHLNVDTDVSFVKDEDGSFLGKVFNSQKRIFDGQVFKCGGYECQINEEVDVPQVKPPLLQSRLKTQVRTVKVSKPKAVVVSTPSLRLISKTQKRMASADPLYDPNGIENPLIMVRPPSSDIPVRDVVVDPSVSGMLRPHQREGVKFLYECVMGFGDFKGHGAILADEMGLGKTLQAIALIWTLLKQTPYVGEKPIAAGKVLICCPVTLVNNWKNEFDKWLGDARGLNVLAIDGKQRSFHQSDKQIIKSFSTTKVYQILIIGYEKMQSVASELEDATIDLVICDEGHRLKNSSNKVFKTLESFKIKRRIILTGTPIQNDLTEFYTLINFTNPNVLGSFKDFQKNFMKPILRSREPDCHNRLVIKVGNAKSEQLIELTKKFILRRTNGEITKYLPKRSDYVFFAPPTKLQVQLFNAVSRTQKFTKILQGEGNSMVHDSLSLITTFRKICNSPSLLEKDSFFLEICGRDGDSEENEKFRVDLGRKVKSGKIMLLMKLLSLIYQMTSDEKVVIISNFTQVLDILQKTLESLRLSYSRLDGSTPSKDRGQIVSNFNNSSRDSCFVFLLSAKAGGVGLNLTGASRLIMFDNDWNPSVDIQAMARVHREGQKKPVKIYRLMTRGYIDEKIFQRQLIKTNLSDRFLDDSAGSNEDFFNHSDLKDIFTVDEGGNCNTHDLMLCKCKGTGEINADEDEEEEEEEQVDDLLDEPPNFITALDYSQKCQDKENDIEQTQKQIKRCLKGYRHIDPLGTGINVNTDDEIIDALIRQQDSKKPLVSYIFGKY
ncbi:DEKNAAC103090 [Brettanomyces naardenensis]|uniref:DEKNAAC103090 n=1 Tax=Brettanomyces naardenensis TaxID=13370 RepID=A0A448YMB3_BRENA|nr:DEKNAAC103090 [Brettanomyces naardenensis]